MVTSKLLRKLALLACLVGIVTVAAGCPHGHHHRHHH
jgi:hypothetical protein